MPVPNLPAHKYLETETQMCVCVSPHRGFRFILILLRVDASTQQWSFPAVHLLLVHRWQLQLLVIFVYVPSQYNEHNMLTC